jgi:hypothetical protein
VVRGLVPGVQVGSREEVGEGATVCGQLASIIAVNYAVHEAGVTARGVVDAVAELPTIQPLSGA